VAGRAVSDAFKLTGTTALLGGAGIAASLVGFAGFQQSLNLLGATAHATTAEMERASIVSKQLGADITLPATSAADAAQAMTELARGGLSAANAIDAARGALQLSAAANISVADASLITAKNINAFALAGTDATKVVDVLTNAYTHSGVGITEFATGLANVSAVAHLNGVSLADVSTALAELTKKGVDASSAGTELRAVILRLAAPTGPAADAIKALGINIFDAKGKMIPFRDVIDQLAKATAGLSQKQQDQAFKQIFGNRAIGEALILAKDGVESFDQMSAAINKSGSAADIAGARMKGLSGTLEGIKSQVETVGISIGQILAPAAQLVLTSLSGISGSLTNFGDALSAALTPTVVTHFTDIIVDDAKRVAGAFHGLEGPAIGAAIAIGSAFASQIPIIGSFFPEVSIVSGVLLGIIAGSAQARDSLLGFGKTLLTIGKEQAPVVLEALRRINAAAGPAFAALFDGASEAARILGPVLGSAIRDLGPPIADLITAIGDFGHVVLPQLAQAAGDLVPILVSGLKVGLEGVSGLLGFLTDNSKVLVPLLAGLAAGFAAMKVAEAAAAGVKLFVTAITNLPALITPTSAALLAIGAVVSALTLNFLDNAEKARANKKAIDDFRDAILNAGNAVEGTNTRVEDIVKGSDKLQKVLIAANTNAEALGVALSGTANDFSAFKTRLIEADIASSGLSNKLKGLLSQALKDSGGNTQDFQDKLHDLGLAFAGEANAINEPGGLAKSLDDLNRQHEAGAKAADQQTKATQSEAQAHKDAAAAADRQRQALSDLAQATLDSISAQVGAQRASTEAKRAAEDQTKAQEDLLKVLADPRSTKQDAITAQRNFEDANTRVTDSLRNIGASAVDAAQKQAVLEGKSKDSVDALSVYSQAIRDAAASNDKLAPAAAGVLKALDDTKAKAPGAGQAIGLGITDGVIEGIAAGTLGIPPKAAQVGQAVTRGVIGGIDAKAIQEGGQAALRAAVGPAVVAQAKADAGAVGAGISSGIAAALNKGQVILAAVDLVRSAIQAAKNAAGIKSPSKVAHDEIGVPLAQGVVEGILAAFPESQAAGRAVIGAVLAGMRETRPQIQDELKSIGDQIQAKVAEIRGTSRSLADAARVNAGVAAAIPFPELVALEVAKRVKAAQDKTSSDAIEKAIQDQVNAQLIASGQIVKGINDPDTIKAASDAQAAAQAAAAKAVSDEAQARAHLQQQEFDHNMISAQEFLADLREQLSRLSPLTDDYFAVLDQITRVNQSITDAAARAAQAQNDQLDAVIHREQLMYDHQLLAADQFLADLQSRMGQVTQFSDAYFALLDEVNKVKADQVKALQAAATGKTFLVQVDNNGQSLDEARLAALLERTVRVTPDAFAVT
jgi:TP901 family phage tail tape measure protein